MNSVNWERVLLVGGLIGGLIYFLLVVVRLKLGINTLDVTGPATTPGLNFLLFGIGACLVFGCMAVWLYASIRPRYGPGPATALRAGLALGLTIGVTSGAWMTASAASSGFTILYMATEVVIAFMVTMLVALMYKESEDDPESSPSGN